ncbi:MAG: flavin reductase family protein [Yoonia sp.]|nr:flavin reductase family protein [Yoonia sp.]
MFYHPKDGHGLPHNPFNAIVAPRPIGWIGSRDKDGHDNLAPYSFFNAVAYEPPQVMFSSTSAKPDRGDTKDSVGNIRETGVFSVNVVSFALKDAMNLTSGAWGKDTDEFTLAGLEKAECNTINAPRVANAPATLECKVTQIITLEGAHNFAVFGEVTGVHIRDEFMTDGMFDLRKVQPLSRLGYQDYTSVTDLFSLKRP